jgi:hypothetical protein
MSCYTTLMAYELMGRNREQRSNGAMEQWMAIIFELSGLWPLNSISKVERRL